MDRRVLDLVVAHGIVKRAELARRRGAFMRRRAQAEKVAFNLDGLSNITKEDVGNFFMNGRNSSLAGAGLGAVIGSLMPGRDRNGKTHRLRNALLMAALGAGAGYGGARLGRHVSGLNSKITGLTGDLENTRSQLGSERTARGRAARQLSETKQSLESERAAHGRTRGALETSQKDLDAARNDLGAAGARIKDLEDRAAAVEAAGLAAEEQRRVNEREQQENNSQRREIEAQLQELRDLGMDERTLALWREASPEARNSFFKTLVEERSSKAQSERDRRDAENERIQAEQRRSAELEELELSRRYKEYHDAGGTMTFVQWLRTQN